jgi:hypothetical protein
MVGRRFLLVASAQHLIDQRAGFPKLLWPESAHPIINPMNALKEAPL